MQPTIWQLQDVILRRQTSDKCSCKVAASVTFRSCRSCVTAFSPLHPIRELWCPQSSPKRAIIPSLTRTLREVGSCVVMFSRNEHDFRGLVIIIS